MLTATYTLIALSVEQTNMRVSLHAVQQLVQKGYTRQSALTSGQAVSYTVRFTVPNTIGGSVSGTASAASTCPTTSTNSPSDSTAERRRRGACSSTDYSSRP